MTTKLIENNPSKKKLWLAAIKPPMYTVAVIPITVGTAAAFAESKQFSASIFVTFLLAAISIIAWLNLSNDFFDSETGIDVNKAHSVVNLTGNKNLVFWLSNLFLVLGILGILLINFWQQDYKVLGIIILCCILGYSYQGPPFRLGYQGLGELICFICFGPLAIAAAAYSQAKEVSATAWYVSIIIGITTSIILFCSHFHQVEDDLKAGKRSPIVRLGTKMGSIVLMAAVVSVFILLGLFTALGLLSPWSLITFLSIPFGYQLVNHVNKYHDQPSLVSNCKFIAVNFHFFSGLLLGMGLVVS